MMVDRVGRRNQLLLEASGEQHHRQAEIVDAELRRCHSSNEDTGDESGNAYDALIEQAYERVSVGGEYPPQASALQ